jgi:SPP1 gp7 family putative phage head morphogenesis protein
MKQIPPIPLKDRYWREIKKEIERIFTEVLFKPLYKAATLPQKELKNAPSTPLEKAIANGTVFYRDGKFQGKFNAAISKELSDMGARWNPKSKTFTYSQTLPAGVQFALATASTRYETIKQAVLLTLDDLNIESIDRLGNLPDKYMKSIEWMEGDWEKAVKGITVSPELTEGELNGISADYAHDMGKYIKDWTEEKILELRQEVQSMVYAGQRPDAIAKVIQTKYGQSKRKAEFLAKQESGLLMSAYTSNRMKDVGATRFKWITSNDERVRHDHRILNNKIFFFSEPPIINQKTGARGLPKQDFGCRCDMIAIIE